MKKQTKVLVAAAMLTLGASFSAMAAQKGTWDNSTGEWMCYDKDGEAYEEEWCLDNGVEFYVNDDGVLASSEWVEINNTWYYAQSDGSKAKGVWKYIYGPEDEDADEESWFYFDAKGKMLENTSKKIGDYTYYFDVDGKMLTGWIQKVNNIYEEAKSTTAPADVYYADENGARASKVWLNCFPYGADEDALYEGEDEVDYWINADGKPQTGKKDIDGLTYFFGTGAQMLSGWVGYYEVASGSETIKYYEELEDVEITSAKTAYYTNDIGYAAKSKWVKAEDPMTEDEFWYHFDKNGKVYIPQTADFIATAANAVTFANGDVAAPAITTDTIKYAEKRIDGVEYLFDEKGKMLTGLIGINNAVYYYGTEDEGAMQTGSELIEDADGYEFYFYFGTESKNDYKKGVAVDGNADGYCYAGGLLQTSGESGLYKVVTTAVGQFLVDDEGKIQHKTSKEYECVDGYSYKFEFGGDNKKPTEDKITKQTKQN